MRKSGASAFWTGARLGIPVILGYIPVGIAYALIARQAGFSVLETCMMSVFVYAGASEMMAAGMYAQGAGIAAIVLATFILNLRHFIMSACVMNGMRSEKRAFKELAAFGVTDEVFAIYTTQKKLERPGLVFLGMALISYLSWNLGTVIGAVASDFLPALLTAALAIYSGISNQSLPSVIVQGVLAPFRAAGTTLTNTAEKYYSYMFRYEALDAENKVLEERIAQMEDVARQADSVSRENERLRKLLELKATNEDYKLVDAYIIGWSSSDWESTFTINRGSNAGIRENLCAITANGEVVGLVTEVGVNYAVVKTVLDSTLEISGTISTSGYNGMVKGGYASGNDTLLQMNYLPSDSIIRNKDQVVTSGSTVYPRGLIIGSVVDAGYEETGVAKFALLDPAADINSLEQVFIITQYTTEVVTTPGTSTGSETATAPSETAATTQPTTPVG